MVSILPALLCSTKGEFTEKLTKVFGLVERVQVDIIDGVYADNKTVTPEEIADINTAIKFDYHLMVDEPINWLDRCLTPQAGMVYGHVERMSDPAKFVAEAEIKGFGVGLALDLNTPVEKIKPWVWDLDGLLLMSVHAGKGGQSFDQAVFEKIKQARALQKDLPLVIDGGLDVPEIKLCIGAEWAQELEEGALNRNFLDISFAVGNRLLSAGNVKTELEMLQNLDIKND